MKERYSYIGKLNDICGVWCDNCPEGLEVKETITFYTPDEGKIFVDKKGNFVDSVVIKDGVNIKDFTEILQPQEETKEE